MIKFITIENPYQGLTLEESLEVVMNKYVYQNNTELIRNNIRADVKQVLQYHLDDIPYHEIYFTQNTATIWM